jgi:hypothetical protein
LGVVLGARKAPEEVGLVIGDIIAAEQLVIEIGPGWLSEAAGGRWVSSSVEGDSVSDRVCR